MTQQRVYNFGDTLTQGRTKTLASKLLSAGVYEGMDPVITGSAMLNISPGAFLLPNGVLVAESTETDNVNYPAPAVWPPTIPSEFTCTADHDDIQAIGGSPVSYTLRPGILPPTGSPTANSVALFWIRHPGGAPLNPGMFSVPPKVKNGAVLTDLTRSSGWLQAPFSDACDVVAGSNIVQQKVSYKTGPQNLGLLVKNTSPSVTQSLQFTLPIPRMPWARRVEVFADIPSSCFISFNPAASTVAAPVAADPLAIVTLNAPGTSGFMVADRVKFRTPAGVAEVTEVKSVLGPYQLVVPLTNSLPAGSVLTSLSVVTAETGEILPASPGALSGVVGLGPTPAGVFTIASGPKPATFGVKVVVSPNSSVFIKGFQFIGD